MRLLLLSLSALNGAKLITRKFVFSSFLLLHSNKFEYCQHCFPTFLCFGAWFFPFYVPCARDRDRSYLRLLIPALGSQILLPRISVWRLNFASQHHLLMLVMSTMSNSSSILKSCARQEVFPVLWFLQKHEVVSAVNIFLCSMQFLLSWSYVCGCQCTCSMHSRFLYFFLAHTEKVFLESKNTNWGQRAPGILYEIKCILKCRYRLSWQFAFNADNVTFKLIWRSLNYNRWVSPVI